MFGMESTMLIVMFPLGFIAGCLTTIVIMNLSQPDRMASREREKQVTQQMRAQAERERSLGKQEAAITNAVSRGAQRMASQQIRAIQANYPVREAPAKMVEQSSRLALLAGLGVTISEDEL